MNSRVAIVEAKRTAVGNFMGSLSKYSAADLGSRVIREIIKNKDNIEISEVIMGQVLTANCGQNPARQALINAGISKFVPAYTINKVCGSGLKSVILGAQSIQLEHSSCIIAGGQESMSSSPHACNLRKGKRMGNIGLVDTMLSDGLTDAFNDYHMGITAENLAKKNNITREEQDLFALDSQIKAAKAQKSNCFTNEIISVDGFDMDEFIKPETTKESLAALKPAFIPNEGTVTPGNSSGINDGAAAVMLMSERMAEEQGIDPMCYVKSFGMSGVDPEIMGIGPVSAINLALKRAKWKIDDLDIIELNEAFAAQSISVLKEINPPESIVNIYGGAIAIGHPIGASGTRCLVTLVHSMKKNNFKRGLVSLCIGGGMGIAMCIER